MRAKTEIPVQKVSVSGRAVARICLACFHLCRKAYSCCGVCAGVKRSAWTKQVPFSSYNETPGKSSVIKVNNWKTSARFTCYQRHRNGQTLHIYKFSRQSTKLCIWLTNLDFTKLLLSCFLSSKCLYLKAAGSNGNWTVPKIPVT